MKKGEKKKGKQEAKKKKQSKEEGEETKKKKEPTKERKANERKKAERWRLVWFGLCSICFLFPSLKKKAQRTTNELELFFHLTDWLSWYR